jgi:putative transposase
LSSKARGRLVREIAAREHTDPAGRRRRISRDTLDRWIRAWRRGGFDALVPDPRQSSPRLPVEVIEMAVALKRENPARTAAQVRRILRAQMGWSPGERTLQRHFAEDPQIAAILGALAAPAAREVRRCSAGSRPTARTSCGPATPCTAPASAGARPTCSPSSTITPAPSWGTDSGFAEDTVRLAAALRPALGSRGVPDAVYVDNGSAFVDAWLLRACAKLGIRLIHSTPGRPQGRGKIERFFRTVREQFLVEITGDPEPDPNRHTVADLDELNRLFTAWVETVYHRREHSETGAPPLQRWHAGGPFPLPTPAALAEAFLWRPTAR